MKRVIPLRRCAVLNEFSIIAELEVRVTTSEMQLLYLDLAARPCHAILVSVWHFRQSHFSTKTGSRSLRPSLLRKKYRGMTVFF